MEARQCFRLSSVAFSLVITKLRLVQWGLPVHASGDGKVDASAQHEGTDPLQAQHIRKLRRGQVGSRRM